MAPRAPAPAPRISTEEPPCPPEPPRVPEPSQRPLRAAFGVLDTKPAGEDAAPELSIDPPAQPPVEPSANRAPDSVHRPIPPIADPAEFFSLRPPVDPLSVSAPLGAAQPVEEDVAPVSHPEPPPVPSPTTNSRLEELASLSEKTLEDYDTFDDFEDVKSDRPKRTSIVILASLLGVGVLAGGVIFAYRQGVQESSPTTLPVIVAGTKAMKEEPVNPGGVKIPNQNKLIYDRILGEETDIAERIVSREEKVVAFNQQPATTNIAKSPSPGTPGAQSGSTSSTAQTPTSPAAGGSEDLLAKKLAESLPKPQSPPSSLTNGNNIGTISETLNLPSNIQEQASAAQGGIVRLETETVAPPGVPEVPAVPGAASESLAIARLVEESIGATPRPVASAKVPPILPRRKPPAPASDTTRITSAAPQTTTAPATAARSTSGNFVVQIAAFRSREEALSRFASLKRRHSGLLGPYTSFVQRADLGDQGIYYRLRLGPIDGKDKASTLCRSLLSAGEKECLVRTR